MKIKALYGIAGIDYTFSKGGVYDVTSDIGNDLVKGGLAVEVKTDERAKVTPVETAKTKK